MKTDLSIKNITLAAIRRGTMDVHDWKYTSVDPKIFPKELEIKSGELAIVSVIFSNNDWTLITTQRVFGKTNGLLEAVDFSEIVNFNFFLGDFKNEEIGKIGFRITNTMGEEKNLLMESGKTSMATIKAIQTIQTLNKSSVRQKP